MKNAVRTIKRLEKVEKINIKDVLLNNLKSKFGIFNYDGNSIEFRLNEKTELKTGIFNPWNVIADEDEIRIEGSLNIFFLYQKDLEYISDNRCEYNEVCVDKIIDFGNTMGRFIEGGEISWNVDDEEEWNSYIITIKDINMYDLLEVYNTESEENRNFYKDEIKDIEENLDEYLDKGEFTFGDVIFSLKTINEDYIRYTVKTDKFLFKFKDDYKENYDLIFNTYHRNNLILDLENYGWLEEGDFIECIDDKLCIVNYKNKKQSK